MTINDRRIAATRSNVSSSPTDANLVELTSRRLVVLVDPRRGGSIRSIHERLTDTDLMFRTGWSDDRPPTPARSHKRWVEQWAGGWHALLPNAGEACAIDGRRHAFHGDASTDRWAIDERAPAHVVLSWTDAENLEISRRIELREAELCVETQFTNASNEDRPFVFVEHLILSRSALGADFELTLPNGLLQPLADDGEPVGDPARLERWPHAMVDGAPQDWRTRPSPGTSRFGTLLDVPGGCARIQAPRIGLALELEWSSTFPYLWYWEENGGIAEPPWNGRGSCLGIEPALCPTSQGLAHSLETDDAVILSPGSSRSFTVLLRVADLEVKETP